MSSAAKKKRPLSVARVVRKECVLYALANVWSLGRNVLQGSLTCAYFPTLPKTRILLTRIRVFRPPNLAL